MNSDSKNAVVELRLSLEVDIGDILILVITSINAIVLIAFLKKKNINYMMATIYAKKDIQEQHVKVVILMEYFGEITTSNKIVRNALSVHSSLSISSSFLESFS